MNRAVTKIYNKLYPNQQVDFNLDDETINKIVAIVKQVVELFKSCQKTPEQALVSVNRPTAYERRQVSRVVRRELGLFQRIFQGNKYEKAVLDAGQDMVLSDIVEVY